MPVSSLHTTKQQWRNREQKNERVMARWTGLLASDALRGGPEHTGAFGAMVLAQALGDEDRQVSRHVAAPRFPSSRNWTLVVRDNDGQPPGGRSAIRRAAD